MNVHILRCHNSEVTDFYLEIIKRALEKASERSGQEFFSDDISDLSKLSGISASDHFIVATALDAFKLYIKGYRNIIIWFQGVEPEESFMRNNSRSRFFILSMIEKFVLKRVKFSLFVSKEMIAHYEKKYKIKISEKNSMIIPCFNDIIDERSFEQPDKYEMNRFCYVGSTAKWQRFDIIVSMYKKIEQKLKDTSLLVLTADTEAAERIIKENQLERYCIRHVKPDEVAHEIRDCKFGFVIRDDCAVNQVSTPTKISNYMANGVIPVFSSCIRDFSEVSTDMQYIVRVDDHSDIEDVLFKIEKLKNISSAEIKKEYKALFSKYYNEEKYIRELTDRLFSSLFD